MRHFWFPAAGLVLGAMTGTGTGAGAAQTVTLDTLSLRALPGVWVQTTPLLAAAAADGLRADSLTAMVETALRDAGIRVLTEDEWQVTIGNPLLLLTVNLIRPSEFLYLYNVELELQQLTTMPRDSQPVFGTTWAAGDVLGTVPAPRLSSLVPRIRQMVDGFIRAYVTAQTYPRLEGGEPLSASGQSGWFPPAGRRP